MYSIVILGTGNVATHMYRALQASDLCQVIQVYNHNLETLEGFKTSVDTTTSLAELKTADLYLMCLKDDVIEKVANQIHHQNGIIAHTSGSQSILNQTNSAVFYPLQTFSKNSKLNYSNIPFCLEANSEKNLNLLKNIAHSISRQVFDISSQQRQTLHRAAVFVCNFTNHLYAIGEDICQQDDMPFDILKALIKETADKVQTNSPLEVQTGPAIRRDQSTIDNHFQGLDNPNYKTIYKLLTQSIQDTYDQL